MTFYGESDWSKKVIYVKTALVGHRSRDERTVFSCISPQDESHDVGKSAFKIKDAFNVFKNRYRFIMGKNFRKNESILK